MNEENNELKFKLSEYLKQIDTTIEKQIDEIPEEILNMLMERSFTDATKLFKEGKNQDFKQLTYVIYRSYILGMLVEKTKSKREIKQSTNKVVKLIL